MAAPHLSHDIICIGSHDTDKHEFHSANATAVHDLFTGGLGPSRVLADCLVGPRVTTDAVGQAFDGVAKRATKNHIIYFSGEGTRRGLKVSDGTISEEMLRKHVAQVRAHAVLLVLDLSIGSQPDDALAPEWLQAVVASRGGLRAAIARATRINTGAPGEGLGRFTAAFVAALESAASDMRFDGAEYISDKRTMDVVQEHLDRRWAMTNLPVRLGDFGDLPLAKSQANASIGAATLVSATSGAGLSVSVSWVIEGRQNVATNVSYTLERDDGTIVGQGAVEVVPENPLQKGKTRIRLPKSVVGRRSTTSASLSRLRWRIAIRDAAERVLAERFVDLA